MKFEKCTIVCKVGKRHSSFYWSKKVSLTFPALEVTQTQTHKKELKGALCLNSTHQKIKAYSMLTQQDLRLEQKSTLFSWSCWPPCSVRMLGRSKVPSTKGHGWGNLHGKFGCIFNVFVHQIWPEIQTLPQFGGFYNPKAEYFSEGVTILKFHILHQGNKLKLSWIIL